MLRKYRIYCDTEEKHIFTDSDNTPTECPNNSGHTISKIVKLKRYKIVENVLSIGNFNNVELEYPCCKVDPTTVECIGFNIPFDFESLEALTLILVPKVTKTAWDIDFNSVYSKLGENRGIHGAGDVTSTYNLTNNIHSEIDIAYLYTDIEKGDRCGLKITNNDITDELKILGIKIKYKKEVD